MPGHQLQATLFLIFVNRHEKLHYDRRKQRQEIRGEKRYLCNLICQGHFRMTLTFVSWTIRYLGHVLEVEGHLIQERKHLANI